MNNKIKLIIGFILTGIISNAYSQVGLKKVAQSTMNFQLVSISAKASAMGEAFNSVGQGSESIFFNPSGITEAENSFDVKLFSTSWIADINYNAVAVAWQAGRYGTLGFSFLNVDYGTIKGTSLIRSDEIALYPKGYRETGNITDANAYSWGLTYGKSVSDQFKIGANIRLAGQNLGSSMLASGMKKNSITTSVFDVGVKYYTKDRNIRFGMSIRNFRPNIKREQAVEQLPLLFSMGFAVNVMELFMPAGTERNSLLLAVDFLHPNNYTERVNIGLEYKLLDMLAIRGGYQSNQDLASWSIGCGLQKNIGKRPVSFDYSYSSFKIFDGVNRLSIGFGI